MGQRDNALAGGRTIAVISRSWRIGYALVGSQFLVAGFHFGAIAPFSPELEVEWALQPAQLGLLGSLLFYAYAAMQIPAGILADMLGSRRVLIISAGITALGAAVFSAAPGFALALVGRLLLGLGTGLIFTAGFRHIAGLTAGDLSANKRFITFFGPFVALNYMGTALASIPLVHVVAMFGWRLPLLATSVVSVVLGVATWLLPDTPKRPSLRSQKKLLAALHLWRRERTIWAYTLIRFLYGSFIGMQTLWVSPLLLVTFGFDREAVGLVLLTIALGQIIGPELGSWMAAYTGRPGFVLIVTAGVYAATCLALLALTQIRASFILIMTAFVVLAMAQTITLIGYSLVSDRVTPELQGTISGMVNIGPWLGSAVFQIMVGYLLQFTSTWSNIDQATIVSIVTLIPLAAIGLVTIPLTRLLEDEQALSV